MVQPPMMMPMNARQTMPSASAAKGRYQIFASSKKEEAPSPKSNALSFRILGKGEAFWFFLKALFTRFALFLKKIAADLLFWIALEIIVLAYLIWKNKQSLTKGPH